jgi:hypothetical protein
VKAGLAFLFVILLPLWGCGSPVRIDVIIWNLSTETISDVTIAGVGFPRLDGSTEIGPQQRSIEQTLESGGYDMEYRVAGATRTAEVEVPEDPCPQNRVTYYGSGNWQFNCTGIPIP